MPGAARRETRRDRNLEHLDKLRSSFRGADRTKCRAADASLHAPAHGRASHVPTPLACRLPANHVPTLLERCAHPRRDDSCADFAVGARAARHPLRARPQRRTGALCSIAWRILRQLAAASAASEARGGSHDGISNACSQIRSRALAGARAKCERRASGEPRASGAQRQWRPRKRPKRRPR